MGKMGVEIIGQGGLMKYGYDVSDEAGIQGGILRWGRGVLGGV
jgi:hypothetical protein